MKTGMDVLQRALGLLGYTGIDGAVDGAQSAELIRRGLDTVNQVMADLWPLEKSIQYMPLLSIQADGDGANQQFFASLYQQKRCAVRRMGHCRGDVLPRVWEG